MINTVKTKSGWVLEYDGRNNDGCMVQGAIAGRRVLVKAESLKSLGLNYEDDPEGNFNEVTSNIEAIQHAISLERIRPKVLARGYEVQ